MSESRTIRVLHVLNELKPSGAEVMLKVAAPLWSQLQVQSEVLTVGAQIGPYAQVLSETGYRIHHIPFERSSRFLVQFLRFLGHNRYDVVHLHAERANFWLAQAAKLSGVPGVVRTVHSIFSFQGPLRIRKAIERWILRLVGVRHVSIGTSVKENEWETFGNPTTCIPNWYDPRLRAPTEFQRASARESFGVSDDCVVITTVGNCSTVKNHMLLFYALTVLPKDLHFVYLHVGQEDDRKSERLLATELGLGEHVQFLGHVHDVEPVLQATDVFVMPSLYEGLGISALEAMAEALPVVITDVPGLRDLGELGDGVVRVQVGAEALAGGILQLASMSKERRRSLGMALSSEVAVKYGVHRGVSDYAKLYRDSGKRDVLEADPLPD